jgi:hypothetical protein
MLGPKQVAKYLKEYENLCLSEADAYNRKTDNAITVTEAKDSGLITYKTFENFLDMKDPERVTRRRQKELQVQRRENFISRPLSERLYWIALSELKGCLRVHAGNLQEIEDAMEIEMESEETGLF